jgi:CubicO group peptidase (beta-lactamase class C family)
MKKLVFLLILPFSLKAQKDYPALLDKYMQAAVSVNQFSGAVLIVKHDSIIYQKNFGTLDYANTKPIDSNSMFELGIITEEFTAAAILMLKDEGKLKLTEPITKYLPELPYKNVTIQHLLTHASGLPDYYDEVMKDKWGTNKYATNDDIIKALAAAKVPLAWQPGTHYNESHYYTEYSLLAAIIEKVSGLKYAALYNKRFLHRAHAADKSCFSGYNRKQRC